MPFLLLRMLEYRSTGSVFTISNCPLGFPAKYHQHQTRILVWAACDLATDTMWPKYRVDIIDECLSILCCPSPRRNPPHYVAWAFPGRGGTLEICLLSSQSNDNGTMVPILTLCELGRFCCQGWSHGFTPSLGCLGRIMPKTVNLALISPDGAAIFGIGRWNFPTSSNPHLITKVVLESRHDSAMDVPPCLWRLFRKVRKWHEAQVRSRWIRFQKSDELSLHSAFGDSRQQKRRIRCLIRLGTKIWRGCLNL